MIYLTTDTTWILTKRASGAAGRYRQAGYQAGAASERVLIHKATHRCFICQRVKYTLTNNTAAFMWRSNLPSNRVYTDRSIWLSTTVTAKCFTSPMDKLCPVEPRGCYTLMTVRQLNSATWKNWILISDPSSEVFGGRIFLFAINDLHISQKEWDQCKEKTTRQQP